jgi:hypothetical protein
MSPELKDILSQAQKLVGEASLEETRQSQLQLISHLTNQTQPEPKEHTENPWLAIAECFTSQPVTYSDRNLNWKMLAEFLSFRQDI